jgi:hypothetical protein
MSEFDSRIYMYNTYMYTRMLLTCRIVICLVKNQSGQNIFTCVSFSTSVAYCRSQHCFDDLHLY